MKFDIGQIYFWHGNKGLFAKAINLYNYAKFDRSNTTHCGIIVNVYPELVLIYEATEKGFIPTFYDKKWLLENENVHIGKINEKIDFLSLFEACQKYKGIKYGWLDIFGIGLSFLFGYKVIGITGKNALICSEAVSRVIYDCTKKVNFAQEWELPYDAITPQHIFLSKYVKIIK